GGHVISSSGFVSNLEAHLGRRGPSPATACGAHYRFRGAPRPAGPQPRDGLWRALQVQRRASAGGASAPRRPAARTTGRRIGQDSDAALRACQATRPSAGTLCAEQTDLKERAMGDVGLMGMHVPGMSWREMREAAVLAEELGYSCLTMGESWGEDALTSLAQLAAATSRGRIGSRIVRVFARSPANLAMTALNMDRMTGG